MLTNFHGCEAVRHKLKNGLKTQKRHFLAVLDLMSDSLTTIYVKQHQCPSHQPILLTQGPIPEIFMKKYRESVQQSKISVFLRRPFRFFFEFLCFILIKTGHKFGINNVQWMELNFQDHHDFQIKARGGYRIMKHIVLMNHIS